ncbi:MAG: tetratricopeptide repeat protein [Spirochaetaceae bacterium]|jgi:tetratricopeptide (TPR) repeat protein|nr:tetratricopeptide repeat protein [Spirochaetaceae bacterium]
MMKKSAGSLLLALILLCPLSAQVSAPVMAEAARGYYQVFSQLGEGDAASLARELNMRFNEYNRIFHFDPQRLPLPLRARIFADKAAYDSYVSSRLGRTRDGAVYLHYTQPEQRELVVLRGSGEEAAMTAHQAFIQFLRAFVASPPAWIREGFSIYYNTLGFDAQAQRLNYRENLVWLDTVKNLGTAAPSKDLPSEARPPLEPVFLADVRGTPEHFQGLSWALVSFFLNSGNMDYFRTLVESFTVLSDSDPAGTNAEAVFKRITQWIEPEVLQKDVWAYLAGRKTFTEYIEAGQAAYTAGDRTEAERNFLRAQDLRPVHFVSPYYLGLLAYEEKDYDQAEAYYRSALAYGADQGLVQYARGLNAASAGRRDDAITFLEQAAAASPQQYGDRAADIISQLRQAGE